jgi:hypothetical protein
MTNADKKLIHPIQFQSLLVFLDLPMAYSKVTTQAMPTEHLLASDHPE